jgi:hypothetical protein
MWAFFGIYSRWVETEYELIANSARLATVVSAVLFGKLLTDILKTRFELQKVDSEHN